MHIPSKKQIEKAYTRLIIDHAFFATILLKQERVEDTVNPTMWVDGKRLGYNPDFVMERTFDELVGVLAHEVMHLVFKHHLRRGDRHPKKWNMACDYVINNSLVDDWGFILPKGALINSAYSGKSADEVYSMLPDPPDGDGDGYGDGGWGEVKDQPGSNGKAMSRDERDKAEAEMKVDINQAYNACKSQGNLPAGIKRMVEEMNDPKLPWREILSRFLGERAKVDYSLTKPNKRFAHMDVIMPGLDGETFGKVVLACDTSCSIDEGMLKEVCSEVLECLNQYDDEGVDVTLTVLWCDTKVYPEEVGIGGNPNPQGGGGTDFAPVFEYIAENNVQAKAVIYITDGECDSFGEQPGIDVIWGITSDGRKDFSPPFGEVMHIAN